MDTILEHKIAALVVFLILIISIPSLTFLIKQRTSFKSQAVSDYTAPKTLESSTSAQKVSNNLTLGNFGESGTSSPSPAPSSSPDEGLTAQVSFGPTLTFQITVQGRPADNQSIDSLFVGIATGAPSSNPQYLLSFTIKVPATGIYSGLSLAGLTVGDTYTAYIKGPSQIASSSAFIVQPNIAKLNSGSPINLLTGDLNEDNVINAADYGIALSNFGKTPTSADWNPNIDFNLDGIINTYDLAIIITNMSKKGAGDVYTSHIASGSANIATQSGVLRAPAIGGPEFTPGKNASDSGGYWMWVPKL